MLLKALAFAIVLSALPAHAADAPPEVSLALPNASQHGTGTLSFLWYDAYKATLWSDGSWSADKPYALTLTYDMDFSASDLIDRSITEMKRAYPAEDVMAVKDDLKKSMLAVKAGDRMTGIFMPPATTKFYHNGQLVSTVTGRPFADMFFGIWLGTKTSEPKLRAALLAEGNK